ncbi:helix-hairpin-helix domain-containing protein [Paraglaciecola aquimarina]|uniref:Helix-hairpin-helix domain-containing protein n=1 Tax=Paraglaciecola algarum TaxID=3050085 RepID=A0ABS9D532_9ALTE|nr:helix-hairpin-helix domain-containing protein [Paraglaciecola sp. G1-23]MCF2948057.1 helix-hairpin-helix domain-containing protein [Paraglaciecola sp. G1-23]
MTATQVLSEDLTGSEALQIQQPCGYRIHNNQISIDVSAIQNNRNAENISGTLALELWALRQPYYSGQFDGVALAGTAIGELLDQHYVGPSVYNLEFQEPPTGQWYICLMLREWTENGYITRDAVNFDLPYISTWKPSIIDGGANTVIHVDFANLEIEPQSNSVKSEAATDTNTNTSVVEEVEEVEEVTAKDMLSTAKAAPKTTNKKAKASKTKKPSTKHKATKASAVSINRAELEQVRAIKGVSATVAQNILTDRPFKTLNDLLKVKGIGPKLLEKIKGQIKL